MKLTVRVTPNATKSEVVSYKDEVLTVRLHASPHEGQANEELIRLLASFFHIPKSNLRLIRGMRGRVKILEIPITVHHLHLLLPTDDTAKTV